MKLFSTLLFGLLVASAALADALQVTMPGTEAAINSGTTIDALKAALPDQHFFDQPPTVWDSRWDTMVLEGEWDYDASFEFKDGKLIMVTFFGLGDGAIAGWFRALAAAQGGITHLTFDAKDTGGLIERWKTDRADFDVEILDPDLESYAYSILFLE